MDDYYQDKRRKRADFWDGFLTNLLVGLIAGGLYLGVFYLMNLFDNTTVRNIIKGISIAVIVAAVALYEIRKIRRHLKARRYIAIGMISALIIPLLVVGTCSPLIFIE